MELIKLLKPAFLGWAFFMESIIGCDLLLRKRLLLENKVSLKKIWWMPDTT